ncbi:MAG: hypothetical protein K0R50_107 [Eubacterium sp.]|nr:hypothetical protein [Eubacterium sp.]
MSPYKKTNKVSDIEKPISSNMLGRDILGINPNISAVNKTSTDIQDEELSMDYMRKIK